MNNNLIVELFIESLKLRKAIEKCSKKILPITFEDFPKGSCGDTSIILGHYLKEKGFGKFDYILGYRLNKSHAWIEQNGLIIDITADQFPDNRETVIVVNNSKWHKEFNGKCEHEADFDLYDENAKIFFFNTYLNILNAME